MAARQSKMGRLLKLLSTTGQNLSRLQHGLRSRAKPYRFEAGLLFYLRLTTLPAKPLLFFSRKGGKTLFCTSGVLFLIYMVVWGKVTPGIWDAGG